MYLSLYVVCICLYKISLSIYVFVSVRDFIYLLVYQIIHIVFELTVFSLFTSFFICVLISLCFLCIYLYIHTSTPVFLYISIFYFLLLFFHSFPHLFMSLIFFGYIFIFFYLSLYHVLFINEFIYFNYSHVSIHLPMYLFPLPSLHPIFTKKNIFTHIFIKFSLSFYRSIHLSMSVSVS